MNMKRQQRIGFTGTALLAALGLLLAVQAQAKDIAIAGNNTSYSSADIQKLAATATKMGVKEPLSLNLQSGNLHVSGSSATACVIKVGNGKTPQIAGISCK